MVLDDASSQNLFSTLMSRQTGETIQDFFNNVHDKVFNFKTVSEEDREELSKLLNDFCGDHLFNEFVLKYFNVNINAWILKSSIQDIKTFPNISLNSAVSVLKDIFEYSQKENVKSYIKWLTFNIDDFIQSAEKHYVKLHLNNDLFYHFVETEALEKYIKHFNFKPGFSLLSFICQHDDENKAVIPALLKYGNIKIEWDKVNSLNNLFTQMIQNYKMLNPENKLKGFNLNSSFENAVALFNYITPCWDKLAATFNLRNKALPTMSSILGGGNTHLTDSDVVRIYTGEYDLVPYSELQNKDINVDVIADYDKFRQFSSHRKLQISHFLLTNRKRFNNIVSSATQLILNNLQTKLDPNVVSSAFRDISFGSSNPLSKSSNQKTSFESDIKALLSKLYKQINSSNIRTFDEGISFIVHSYIPLITQFKNKSNEIYGASLTSNMLSKLNFNKTLNIIGVASNIESYSPSTTLSLNSKHVEPVIQTREKIIEKPVIKYINQPAKTITKYVTLGGVTSNSNNSYARQTPQIEDLLISAQKSFNKSYEDIYRKLISALNLVKLSQVQSQTVTKLSSICTQFENISIRNPKTTIYLSGYYGAKNYNRIYAKYLSNTISTIETSGVTGFEDVTKYVKDLQELVDRAYKNANDIKTKYITSSKTVSEALIIAANKIKIPCQLTQKDFNAFADAIRRISNSIVNYSMESATYNLQQQTENYIAAINNREKTIIEHYDIKIQGIKTAFALYKNTTREFEYAKEIQININQQKKDIMLYLNKVVDIKLAKERLDRLHEINLSPSQIENIERACLSFKNVQITDEFNKLMHKIDKLIAQPTIAVVFKLIKKLRTLITKSGYLQFIVQIYKEMGIFGESFNWSEFIEKYTTLTVISSISIDRLLELKKDENNLITRGTKYSIAHYIAKQFELLCPIARSGDFKYPKYNVYIAVLNMFLQNIKKLDKINGNKQTVYDYFGLSAHNYVDDTDICCGYKYKASDLTELSAEAKDIIQNLLFCMKENYDAYTLQNNAVPYYIHKIAKVIPGIITEFKGPNKSELTDLIKTYTLKEIDEWGISVTNSSSELALADFSIEALFTNIIAIVDKYWSIKYNGSLNIPLNINMLMRGGFSGGSIFDSMHLHDQTNSSIILEAVPFYICALHICYYYISTFSLEKKNESGLELRLTINKISYLYPIYEIFYKYHSTIESLTPQQLKICVAAFNDVWNQTQGNAAARLSRSIDILFSELNSCFIFTNKLQYEIIKSTNSLSKSAVDIIDDKITYLVNKMKATLMETACDQIPNNELNYSYLEHVLSSSFKEIKQTQESQRFAKLKALLTKNNEGSNLQDYYAFMELVISPLLICAKSYSYIFSLFSYASSTLSAINEEKLDFTKYHVCYSEFDGAGKETKCIKSIWDVIENICSQKDTSLKSVLIESPVVVKYNQLLLRKALQDFHKTDNFVLPRFWVIMDEKTYPRNETFEIPKQEKEKYSKCDGIDLLRQIYPTVEAKNLNDYYNHCITEMIADYDHFIHAFLTYPGLSDKTIKLVSTAAHDALKIENLIDNPVDNITPYKYKDPNGIDKSIYAYGLQSDKNDRVSMYSVLEKLKGIKIDKHNYYVPPPPINVSDVIPRFADISIYEGITLSTSPIFGQTFNRKQQAVLIEGTGIYALISYNPEKNEKIEKCENTWLDWVIYSIARCDKINFMLPYKFLQMLQDYPGINNLIHSAVYNRKDQSLMYSRNAYNVYNNILTQNIIARSSVLSNKEKSDLSLLNSSWVANLISVIPYLINTLVANKRAMTDHVAYNGTNVQQLMSFLIDILTSFYDTLSNYAPHIPFLSNTVHLNSNIVKANLFAELLQLISKSQLIEFDSSDFIKLEWANQYFFNYIDNIQFPEYKHRNRFEWINQYASSQLLNGAFKTEFDTSIQIMGKLAWSGLIAKSFSNINVFMNSMEEIDETIVKIIHVMSECDMKIVQQYIQNIIMEYKGMNQTLSGGKMVFMDSDKEITNDEEIRFIRRITKGLCSFVKDMDNRLQDAAFAIMNLKRNYMELLKIAMKQSNTYDIKSLEKDINDLEEKYKHINSSNNETENVEVMNQQLAQLKRKITEKDGQIAFLKSEIQRINTNENHGNRENNSNNGETNKMAAPRQTTNDQQNNEKLSMLTNDVNDKFNPESYTDISEMESLLKPNISNLQLLFKEEESIKTTMLNPNAIKLLDLSLNKERFEAIAKDTLNESVNEAIMKEFIDIYNKGTEKQSKALTYKSNFYNCDMECAYNSINKTILTAIPRAEKILFKEFDINETIFSNFVESFKEEEEEEEEEVEKYFNMDNELEDVSNKYAGDLATIEKIHLALINGAINVNICSETYENQELVISETDTNLFRSYLNILFKFINIGLKINPFNAPEQFDAVKRMIFIVFDIAPIFGLNLIGKDNIIYIMFNNVIDIITNLIIVLIKFNKVKELNNFADIDAELAAINEEVKKETDKITVSYKNKSNSVSYTTVNALDDAYTSLAKGSIRMLNTDLYKFVDQHKYYLSLINIIKHIIPPLVESFYKIFTIVKASDFYNVYKQSSLVDDGQNKLFNNKYALTLVFPKIGKNVDFTDPNIKALYRILYSSQTLNANIFIHCKQFMLNYFYGYAYLDYFAEKLYQSCHVHFNDPTRYTDISYPFELCRLNLNNNYEMFYVFGSELFESRKDSEEAFKVIKGLDNSDNNTNIICYYNAETYDNIKKIMKEGNDDQQHQAGGDNESKITYFKGGVITMTRKSELILDVAQSLANNIFNRAVYEDNTFNYFNVKPTEINTILYPNTILNGLYNRNLFKHIIADESEYLNIVAVIVTKFGISSYSTIDESEAVTNTMDKLNMLIINQCKNNISNDITARREQQSDFYFNKSKINFQQIQEPNSSTNNEIFITATKSFGRAFKFSPHYISLNKDFFKYATAQNVTTVAKWLISPQKDIYNATLLNSDDSIEPGIYDFSKYGKVNNNDVDMFYHSGSLQELCQRGNYICEKDLSSLLLQNTFENDEPVEINLVHTFITKILSGNITTIMSSKNVSDYGFKSSIPLTTLSGGFEIHDNLISSIVNCDDINYAETAQNKLSCAYYGNKANSNTSDETPKGIQLYRNVLGALTTNLPSNNKAMTYLIINYFHKFNISFNSMFNQVCFPSILYNSAILRVALSRINTLIKTKNLVIDKNTIDTNLLQFLLSYLYYYTETSDKSSSNVIDICKDMNIQVSDTSNKRETKQTMSDIVTQIKTVLNDSAQPKYLLGNQFAMPSISNAFMSELVHYIAIHEKSNDNTTDKYSENEHISELLGSGILSSLRHLDSLVTFTSVLFMLLKQTSYYDNTTEKDVSYFNTDSPEPFSVN